jgi:RHS repeat-associated protein
MDNEGNILSSFTKIADNINQSVIVSSQKVTYNGYSKRDNATANPNPFKNAPANVVSEQTHMDTPGNPFTVTRAFTYNTNGSLNNKTDFSGSPNNALITSYTYDQVGNILTTTTGNRTTTLEYTSDKRFVKKQIDALNYYTEVYYDCWGNPLTKWDVNRLQTDYLYDSWGRLISVTAPDGRKVISSVYWFDKGNASSYKPASTLYYTSSYDEDNHFIGAEYFDAAGHSLRKTEGGFNGRVSYSDAAYTPLGQVYTVSDPFPAGTTATKITSYHYDNLGRMDLQTLPNLVTIATKPSDDNLRKVTTTYSTGEIYTKEYDASGLLTKATDPGGNITYIYNSNGKPKTIQPAGGAGTTTITYYPETGLQETLSDASAGLSRYTYTLFGELKDQTDANSKTTTLDYDILGRLKTKTTGTIVTTCNYDDTGAIGLVKNITKTDGTGMSYKYDALCRITEETRSKGTDAFTYKYEYDAKSRVSKQTYPNAMALTYGYNSLSGDLTSIVKDGIALWSLGATTLDVNDLGQILKVTLGNSKTTSYGYDTQNRLISISATNIVNFGYQFNDKQQLDFRDEKIYDGNTMVGFKESFFYDEVNRLSTATKDNGNTPLTMTYKAGVNDRIATKSDAATYNYPDVTKYKIDNISNLKALFPRHDLTYNDEGHTTLVTETNAGIINKTVTLEYGLDGQRFKTEYTQDGSRKYTRYYFDNYEKEIITDNTTRHLNYIYAAGTLIAIFEQKTGGDKMHYVYTDYLGSLRCITSDNGTIEQRLSYDAWGSRRDYQTGLKLTDTQVVLATTLTSRGFTGQEHIDGMGLINLNARFYEPALGIFLSPDNYVQALDNSQNFNRYTYCWNNPLIYKDPSGELIWIIPNIGWSKEGGLSIGLSVVVGVPGGLSVQAGIGYSFGSNDAYGYVGASAAMNTAYASYSLNSGGSVGYTGGLSPFSGLPISTNFGTVGINYNISHNSWSGNVSAWSVDQNGWTFNPSVSVMVFPEQTTNLVRGGKFLSNKNMFDHQMEKSDMTCQEILDYNGFNAMYSNKFENPAWYDYSDNGIYLSKDAFSSYDNLYGYYMKENYYAREVQQGGTREIQSKADLRAGGINVGALDKTELGNAMNARQEIKGYMYAYKNQGLYPNTSIDFRGQINNIFGPYVVPNPYQYNPSSLQRAFYRIPRYW